jgi:hypothetical protein
MRSFADFFAPDEELLSLLVGPVRMQGPLSVLFEPAALPVRPGSPAPVLSCIGRGPELPFGSAPREFAPAEGDVGDGPPVLGDLVAGCGGVLLRAFGVVVASDWAYATLASKDKQTMAAILVD